MLFADLDHACGSDPSRFCELVFDLTGNDNATRAIDLITAGPLRILLIVVGGIVARRLIHRSIKVFVESQVEAINATANETALEAENDVFDSIEAKAREHLSRIYDRTSRAELRLITVGSVLRSVSTVAVAAITGLLVLSEANIDLGPLLAGAGIAGIALGFGAQSLVRDFLAGIFIVVEDQFGVDDVVDLGEATGVVENVSLRKTRLRDVNGTVWYVPNGEIRRVANQSNLWARSVIDFTVAYEADIDQAMAVIKAAADEAWRSDGPPTILEEPEMLGVQALDIDAVVLRLIVKTEPAEQFATARALRRLVKLALDRAGVDIPFAQRTIWVRDGERAALEAARRSEGTE